MPLILETAQTLAIGPFNPYIITPEWLVKLGICADEEVEIRVHPLKQGLAFTFKDVDWRIDFRMLVVESREAKCGELVGKVLHYLPHTPVRSVANNFNFASSKEDWVESPFLMNENSKPPGFSNLKNATIEETRWSWVIRYNDTSIDLTVAKQEVGIAVLFSFHRGTKGSSEEARNATACFEADRQMSLDLIQRLFNQEARI